MKKYLFTLGCIATLALFTACGAETEPSTVATSKAPTGRLRIVMHDAPTPAVDEVWVEFDEVKANHATQGWQVVSTATKSFDLLKLQNGLVEELGLATLPTGDYDQVRLHLTRAWVIVGGVKSDLNVPSGTESGLKINSAFTLPECGTVTMTLDWDAGAHLVNNKGQGWILRPTIKVESVTQTETCGPEVINLPGRYIRGLAYDNGHLWMTHSDQVAIWQQGGNYCRVGKLDLGTRQLVLNSATEHYWNGRGITIGAGHVWVVDARADVIHRLDPSTLLETGTFRTPGTEGNEITFDGQHLWLTDPWFQRIYELTTSGSVVSSFPIPNVYRGTLVWSGTGLWTNDGPAQLVHYTTSGTIDRTHALADLPPNSGVSGLAIGEGKLFVAYGGSVYVYPLP